MIKHNRPYLDSEDSKAIRQVIDSGYIADGGKVEEFEKALVGYLGKRGFACAVSSGTSALFLALYALGVGENDEVILPTYVCSAVLNAIYMIRAIPVLVDVNEEDFNISANAVKKALTRKTRAIIVVHTYGVPVDMDEISRFGVPIIEDCAQSIGGEYKGNKLGTIGELSVFSFYATKLLATGHGGMIYSKKKGHIKKIMDYREYDCHKQYYPRFNFMMSDLQAALGLSQLKKLDYFLERRALIASTYYEHLSDKNISYQTMRAKGKLVYYRFIVRTKNIGKVLAKLSNKGIGVLNPLAKYELLHNYLGLKNANYQNAEKIARSTVSLPIYPALTAGELARITKALEIL